MLYLKLRVMNKRSVTLQSVYNYTINLKKKEGRYKMALIQLFKFAIMHSQ